MHVFGIKFVTDNELKMIIKSPISPNIQLFVSLGCQQCLKGPSQMSHYHQGQERRHGRGPPAFGRERLGWSLHLTRSTLTHTRDDLQPKPGHSG